MTMRFDLSKYWSPVFIETGTRSGDSVARALENRFENIYSIELSERFYEECRFRFEDQIREGTVELLLGSSTERLPEILNRVDVRATFWLDAHWSGPRTPTAKGDEDVPLMKELEIISRHNIHTHTILIDDVRLFGGDDRDGVDWSSVQEKSVISLLKDINPSYRISYERGHVADDVLVACL